jgi:thiol:disulfide interchange protein
MTQPVTPNCVGLWIRGVIGGLLVLGACHKLPAQTPALGRGGFGSLGGLELPASEPEGAATVKWDARWILSADGKQGRVYVRAVPQGKFYVYSVTQPPGGPLKTKFQLMAPEGVRLRGEPRPNVPPEAHEYPVWPGLVVEEHSSPVTWELPFTVDGPIEPKTVEIKVVATGQACEKDGACIPFKETLVAEFAGSYVDTSAEQPYRGKRSHSEWTIRLEPSVVRPGEQATIIVGVQPDTDYHVYANLEDEDQNTTLFVIDQRADLKFGAPQASRDFVTKELAPGLPPASYHVGAVEWRIPVKVPANAAAGSREISGLVAYQTCTDSSCDPPTALRFTFPLTVGDAPSNEAVFAIVQEASAKEVIEHSDRLSWSQSLAVSDSAAEPQAKTEKDPASGPSNASSPSQVASPRLGYLAIFGLSLLGGLLLNVMPCSFPVIGLKAMSIVKQAGESRRRVIALNAWYVLGILIFFWTLAAIVLVARAVFQTTVVLGEQNIYEPYNIAMTLIVFSLALSLLGFWELPIPGFASSQTASKLQHQEGWLGSLFMGIFTTLLALSCAAPGIGIATGYAIPEPAWVVITIYTCLGLGMGFPFLLIGAFPALLKFLPKPGMWMEHFKQFMGFLMLGAMVFLFWSISDKNRVATLAAMIATWFGLWLATRVPPYAPLGKQLFAWSSGAVLAAVIGWGSFQMLVPGPTLIAWEPYDPARLDQLRAQGKTVMIDFTADWCLNCKLNSAIAINRPAVAKFLADNDVVAMLADWTDGSDDIRKKLEELENPSIPFMVIYPGKQPDAPIKLPDILTEGKVLDALQQAGPSVSSPVAVRTSGQERLTASVDRLASSE